MARAIDAVQVLHNINLHHKPTPVSEFESGFNNGLNQAMWEITHAPTLTQPNEPLTLEELSLFNSPVWIRRIGDEDLSGDGWAIVEGTRCFTWHNMIPASWEILVWWPGSEVVDCPKCENYGKTWLAYRHPPEGEEEENDVIEITENL